MGVVFYSLSLVGGWFGRRWGHLELLPPGNLGVERCVCLTSIHDPLQSVQRDELWESYPCLAVLLCCSSGG